MDVSPPIDGEKAHELALQWLEAHLVEAGGLTRTELLDLLGNKLVDVVEVFAQSARQGVTTTGNPDSADTSSPPTAEAAALPGEPPDSE